MLCRTHPVVLARGSPKPAPAADLSDYVRFAAVKADWCVLQDRTCTPRGDRGQRREQRAAAPPSASECSLLCPPPAASSPACPSVLRLQLRPEGRLQAPHAPPAAALSARLSRGQLRRRCCRPPARQPAGPLSPGSPASAEERVQPFQALTAAGGRLCRWQAGPLLLETPLRRRSADLLDVARTQWLCALPVGLRRRWQRGPRSPAAARAAAPDAQGPPPRCQGLGERSVFDQPRRPSVAALPASWRAAWSVTNGFVRNCCRCLDETDEMTVRRQREWLCQLTGSRIAGGSSMIWLLTAASWSGPRLTATVLPGAVRCLPAAPPPFRPRPAAAPSQVGRLHGHSGPRQPSGCRACR